MARDSEVGFYEPTLALLSSGRLISHLRTEGPGEGEGYVYQVSSDDGGRTWTKPWRTPMWGFPAHIVQLNSGQVVSVYGYRRKPYGVRACISSDEGRTWNFENEIIVRDDLANRVIGYPAAIVLEDDTVFVVYWDENSSGVTSITGTFVHL